jgi:hypothetical protein
VVIRAVAKSSRIYIGPWLAIELAAVFVLLGAATSTPVRIPLFLLAAALLAIGASGNVRRRIAAMHPRATTSVQGDVVIDRDGLVAVLELGRPDEVLAVGALPLPDVGGWAPLSHDGPEIRLQLVIQHGRALLAIRAAPDGVAWAREALPVALASAVRRAHRRLEADGTASRRLNGEELRDVTSACEAVEQIAEVPLGAEGMTTELLAHLTSVAASVTWDQNHAAVRAPATAIARLAPARRLDGTRLATTLPLALDRRPTGRTRGLMLQPAGVPLGVDRDGNVLTITAVRPVRVLVVGGSAAGEVLAKRAAAVRVPLSVDVLDRPTGTDAAALLAADVVVCQPMPAAAAAVVAAALGLSDRTAGWLTRIAPGMVAVIADGRVRWARLSTQPAGVFATARS